MGAFIAQFIYTLIKYIFLLIVVTLGSYAGINYRKSKNEKKL